MKTFLQVNLAARTAELPGGGAWQPPVMTFGESLTIALRTVRDTAGQTVEFPEDIRSLKAAVGPVDARPEAGTFRIKVGSGAQTGANTTGELSFRASAAQVEAALNALAGPKALYGEASASVAAGSWVLLFGSGATQVPLTVVSNRLAPVSFGRVGAWQVDGRWVHDLRLVQAPVAYTDSAPRVLPEAPAISTVQDGGSNGLVTWDEIQALYIPPEFRGSYQLKIGYSRTGMLSVSDTAATIQAALNAIILASFVVTNPLPNVAHIRWIGDYAGADQEEMEVVVADAPLGDLTFTLDFKQAALAVLLRDRETVTLPLEVWVEVAEERLVGTVRQALAFRQDITLRRPVAWDDLAEDLELDWLRPPSPKDYIPYTADQVITGNQHYVTTLGDGAATEFTIDHNLGTEALHVTVRENVAGGRLLGPDEYQVTVDSEDAITVTVVGDPVAAAALAVCITSAGPVSAFQAHTHTVAQIDCLETILEDLGGRIEDMEFRWPEGATVSIPTVDEEMKIEFTPQVEALFGQLATAAKATEPVTAEQVSGRKPAMLPAVHDATTATLPDPLPDPAAGTVWESDRAVLLPGGGGIRSAAVADGDFVASDGRYLYKAIKRDDKASYFPAAFERELWAIHINEKMLAVGKTLDVRFGIGLHTILADCRAQWVLVVEAGEATDETVGSPDVSAEDLLSVAWDVENPLIRQRLIVQRDRIVHSFRLAIERTADELLATRYLYTTEEACNDLAPSTANFALRARLIDFDTENSATTAKGWVVMQLTAPARGELGARIF